MTYIPQTGTIRADLRSLVLLAVTAVPLGLVLLTVLLTIAPFAIRAAIATLGW